MPARLRARPRFRLDEVVPTDGWTAHFTLRSDFGTLEAAGREILEIRVAEIGALERLEEVTKTEVFAEASKRAALKPYHLVKAVWDRPVDTLKGIPKGVGRFFKRTARKVKKGVLTVKDAKDDADAAQRAAETGEVEEREERARAPKASAADRERSAAAEAGDVAKDVFGWTGARRAWARELGIDPYTTNPILSAKLDEVAWAAFSGGFAVGTMMPTLPGPVSTVTTVSDLVWTLPPIDLEARNEKVLSENGIEGRPVRDFFRNGHFTPTLQTALVDALAALRGAGGRRLVIPLAAEVESEEEARFLVRSLDLLSGLHSGRRPLDVLRVENGLVVAFARDGELVVPIADDCVSWVEPVDEALRGEVFRHAPRSVWLTGKLTPRARQELRKRDYRVVEGSPTRLGAGRGR